MIDAHAPVEVFDEIDSTILEARRRAERGEIESGLADRQAPDRGRGPARPRLVVARWQSSGHVAVHDRCSRRRRSRSWVSPPELRLPKAIDAMIGGGRATLKWPNDVFIDSAKAAGIMLDSGALAGGRTWAALAFGVNLAAAPENLDQATISLRDVLPPDAAAPEPLAFLAATAPDALKAGRRASPATALSRCAQAWLKRAHGLGQTARVMQGDKCA